MTVLLQVSLVSIKVCLGVVESLGMACRRGGDNQRDWQMITTDPNYADDPQASNS